MTLDPSYFVGKDGIVFSLNWIHFMANGHIRHIVMFDFSDLSTETIDHLIAGFVALKDIPEVIHLEWGVENNAEDSALGFTHCFILTFANFSARTKYLESIEHRQYEKEVMKYRRKVLVFDFAINNK